MEWVEWQVVEGVVMVYAVNCYWNVVILLVQFVRTVGIHCHLTIAIWLSL